MDTRDKRGAAIGIALAFRLVLPNPDGMIDQPDRQQTAYSYPGITSAPLNVLEICDTSWQSLMPVRTVLSLMPTRTVIEHCED